MHGHTMKRMTDYNDIEIEATATIYSQALRRHSRDARRGWHGWGVLEINESSRCDGLCRASGGRCLIMRRK